MRVLNGRVLILGGKSGKAIGVIWLIAELVAYALVLTHASLLAALSIGVGSTVLGVFVLRLIGREFVRMPAPDLRDLETLSDLKALPMALIGAVLLLLPGFLSDLAGLILVILGYRAFLRRPERPAGAREVDLERGEWKRLPDDDSPR